MIDRVDVEISRRTKYLGHRREAGPFLFLYEPNKSTPKMKSIDHIHLGISYRRR